MNRFGWLVKNKRVFYALTSNGLVAITSFLLSVAVARVSSVQEFADFSLALLLYLFTNGIIRASFTDNALSLPDDRSAFQLNFQRAAVSILLFALALLAISLVIENSYLLYLAIGLPGLNALDFIRVYDSAVGRSERSLAATSAWTIPPILTSLLSIYSPLNPEILFILWVTIGAIIGYILMVISRLPFRLTWKPSAGGQKIHFIFGADYLVGSGGSLMATALLGTVNDPKVLGAIRGSGTILGPLNLLSTTARSLTLPFLARKRQEANNNLKSASLALALQLGIMAPVFLFLQFIPNELGQELLGETWNLAEKAILPMSIEAIFAIICAVAVAGHRVAFAGKRTLFIRIILGIPRPFIVLGCAYQWGIPGAAWSMAILSIFYALVWWASYVNLERKKTL